MFKYYIGSIVAILIAANAAFFTHYTTLAILLGGPGTLLLLLGWLLFAAAWDSRASWPHAGFLVRLGNIITYQRPYRRDQSHE